MTPQPMPTLSSDSRDDIAFKLLPQILSVMETKYSQSHRQVRFKADILERVCNAVIATDVKGNIIYYNRFAQKLYQWEAEKVIGRNIGKVMLSPDSCQIAETFFANLLESGYWQGELIGKRDDGSKFVADTSFAVIRDDAEDKVRGFAGVFVDATERKRAERELKELEYFRLLVQNSSDIISVLEADGTITYVNAAVERILGYKPEELVGKKADEYVEAQEKPTAQKVFADSLKQPGVVILKEFRVRHESGRWIYIEAAVNNLLDSASIKGVVVNCRDITSRRTTEAALQQQHLKEQEIDRFARKLHSYLDIETLCAIAAKEISQMLQVEYVEIQQYLLSRQVWLTVAEYPQPAGVSNCLGVEVVDVDNEISRKLKQLEVVYVSSEDAEARKFLNPIGAGGCLLVPLHFQQRFWGSLRLMRVGDGDEWQELEVEWVKAIAHQLAITIQQSQLYQQSSEINADLERQVQERTAQLEQKIQELQELNVLKDDFLSTVSHELRTPLANMKMALQMLKIATAIERRERYLSILESECTRETELINDLLDLQRLEVANYAIALERINLLDWFPGIVEPFFSRTTEQRQTLEVDIPADLPPMVSDRTSLGRVLAELLNNACKYTPPGNKICLSVSYSLAVETATIQTKSTGVDYKTPDDAKMMRFTISNQGEIPAAELPRIFEKFYRVPNADPWKRGGTGLGLALVQKLISQMEGTIDVTSAAGWTTFTIQIPILPSERLKKIGHPRI